MFEYFVGGGKKQEIMVPASFKASATGASLKVFFKWKKWIDK